MKSIITFSVVLLVSLSSMGQNNFTALNTSNFPQALEEVLHDFPLNFSNIRGELVLAQGEVENYASLVQLPGAEECVITRYHSVEDTTASWRAIMFRTEDFKSAAAQYTSLYKQLKGCYLKLVDGSIIYLNSEWEAPKEENDFASSTFKLAGFEHRYREMKIELGINYQFPDWQVSIDVVSKKKDSLEGYANPDGQ